LADAHTTSLEKVEPTFYEPVAPATLPSLLVEDVRLGAVKAVLDEFLRQQGGGSVRVTSLSENLERSLKESRVVAGLSVLQ